MEEFTFEEMSEVAKQGAKTMRELAGMPTGIMNDKVARHKEICLTLNGIYEKKNMDYGDAFHISYLEEGMAMPRIRLGDKLNRFKTLSKHPENQKVQDESIKDTLLDLANYAIMTVIEMEENT